MVTVAEFTPLDSPQPHVKSTSLMEATPPVIVRALSLGYPLFLAADRILGILTWTTPDKFQSLLLVSVYIMAVRNFEKLVVYYFPFVLAGSIALLLYSMNNSEEKPPTLDESVYILERASKKYRKFISPLTNIHVTGKELVRFALSSLILSPLYFVISAYLVTFKNLVIFFGTIILTWHSLWFRVARSIAWRSPLVRWIAFIFTGIDRTQSRSSRAHSEASALSSRASRRASPNSTPKRDVTFTFVVMENQRHWLGIGWTSNLLPEERSAWTDPSLNEVSPIESFKLPVAEGTGMCWKWMDSEWLLDLSHDNAIPLSNKQRFSLKPGPDDGYIYYNSMWSSPSTQSGFSKYTRNRRWVRKANLVTVTEEVSDRLQGMVSVQETETKVWIDPKERGHEGVRLRNNKSLSS